jgi:hypothetical protein
MIVFVDWVPDFLSMTAGKLIWEFERAGIFFPPSSLGIKVELLKREVKIL